MQVAQNAVSGSVQTGVNVAASDSIVISGFKISYSLSSPCRLLLIFQPL